MGHFDALLARALEDRDGPLYLVTTIRSDFVARFGELPDLEKHLNDATTARYHVKPMTERSLRLAIEGPAGLAGLQWEAGLPERLVADALSSRTSPMLVATRWPRRYAQSVIVSSKTKFVVRKGAA